MSSYEKNNLIIKYRKRQRLKQIQLMGLKYMRGKEATVSKIENNHHSPRKDTFERLMNSMDVSIDTFFCPYLESYDMNIFAKRSYILNLLEEAEEGNILPEEIMKQIDMLAVRENFDHGINKQFILSCKTQLNEISNGDPLENLEMLTEGIGITYKDFHETTFQDDI